MYEISAQVHIMCPLNIDSRKYINFLVVVPLWPLLSTSTAVPLLNSTTRCTINTSGGGGADVSLHSYLPCGFSRLISKVYAGFPL